MQKFGNFAQSILTPLAVLLMAGVLVHDHLQGVGPNVPSVVVNGRGLGRSYAPQVASSLGDAWLAAADAIERGQSMTEAQAALQKAWQDSRVRAFSAGVAPEFSRVLPEGQEPTDPVLRARVVKLWRDFAAGLKGGR